MLGLARICFAGDDERIKGIQNAMPKQEGLLHSVETERDASEIHREKEETSCKCTHERFSESTTLLVLDSISYTPLCNAMIGKRISLLS